MTENKAEEKTFNADEFLKNDQYLNANLRYKGIKNSGEIYKYQEKFNKALAECFNQLKLYMHFNKDEIHHLQEQLETARNEVAMLRKANADLLERLEKLEKNK